MILKPFATAKAKALVSFEERNADFFGFRLRNQSRLSRVDKRAHLVSRFKWNRILRVVIVSGNHRHRAFFRVAHFRSKGVQ